jgi:hypothetical protein
MYDSYKEKIIKRIIDLETGYVVGEVLWQFIYDLEELSPEQVNSEIIMLNHDLLYRIPDEWKKEHDLLNKYLSNKKEIYLGVSHIYKEGNEYTISGALKKSNKPLRHHKIVFYDYQRIFDHYVTSIITDENGEFKFSFDKSFLHHHQLRKNKIAIPSLVLKIYAWKNKKFNLIATIKFKPEELNMEKYDEGKMIIRLGIIYLK